MGTFFCCCCCCIEHVVRTRGAFFSFLLSSLVLFFFLYCRVGRKGASSLRKGGVVLGGYSYGGSGSLARGADSYHDSLPRKPAIFF